MMAAAMDRLIEGGQHTYEAMQKEIERLRVFEDRWKEAHVNPVGMSHLLNLLDAGRGTHDDFDNMVDRVILSRALAAAKRGT